MAYSGSKYCVVHVVEHSWFSVYLLAVPSLLIDSFYKLGFLVMNLEVLIAVESQIQLSVRDTLSTGRSFFSVLCIIQVLMSIKQK